MRTVNFSDARNNLKAVLDRVVEDADVTIIHRRDAEDVVVMSLAQWNSWQETNYLLANPANARRLNEALAQARAGKARPRELDRPEFAGVHEQPGAYKVPRPARKRTSSKGKRR